MQYIVLRVLLVAPICQHNELPHCLDAAGSAIIHNYIPIYDTHAAVHYKQT